MVGEASMNMSGIYPSGRGKGISLV